MAYVDRHKTPRTWSIQTKNTRNIGARLPNDFFERVKNFCDVHGLSITDLVRIALVHYRDEIEEGGQALFL